MSPPPRIRNIWSAPGRRIFALYLIVAVGTLAGWMRFGRVSLDITPAVFPECEGPNIVVHVRWDASSVTKEPVYLLFHKPGRKSTVWLTAGPKGEADTGKWASDGWTIALADVHHRRLAKQTLETTPCPAGKR